MGNESRSEAYAAAGVDITAGYEAVRLMKKHIAGTMIPGAGEYFDHLLYVYTSEHWDDRRTPGRSALFLCSDYIIAPTFSTVKGRVLIFTYFSILCA